MTMALDNQDYVWAVIIDNSSMAREIMNFKVTKSFNNLYNSVWCEINGGKVFQNVDP